MKPRGLAVVVVVFAVSAILSSAVTRLSYAREPAYFPVQTVQSRQIGQEFSAREQLGISLRNLRSLIVEDSTYRYLLAAPQDRWQFAWVRDSTVGAVALSRVGDTENALGILLGLAHLQRADGSFAPRYRVPEGVPPDSRPDQGDGPGWFIWAAATVWPELSNRADLQDSFTQEVIPAVLRATELLLSQTAAGTQLPPVSGDFWERPEKSLPLGVAVLTLAGLQGSETLAPLWAEGPSQEDLSVAQERFAAVVAQGYGPDYPRYSGGSGADTSCAMALVLLRPQTLPGLREAWEDGLRSQLRSGGGFAPGEGWKQDGISWTPATSTQSWAAAEVGEVDLAVHYLRWLSEVRLPDGMLPEKVLWEGTPAGPAPLAWSEANVILTILALSG